MAVLLSELHAMMTHIYELVQTNQNVKDDSVAAGGVEVTRPPSSSSPSFCTPAVLPKLELQSTAMVWEALPMASPIECRAYRGKPILATSPLTDYMQSVSVAKETSDVQ